MAFFFSQSCVVKKPEDAETHAIRNGKKVITVDVLKQSISGSDVRNEQACANSYRVDDPGNKIISPLNSRPIEATIQTSVLEGGKGLAGVVTMLGALRRLGNTFDIDARKPPLYVVLIIGGSLVFSSVQHFLKSKENQELYKTAYDGDSVSPAKFIALQRKFSESGRHTSATNCDPKSVEALTSIEEQQSNE